MESELSIPRNLQPLDEHVRGADRVSAAASKREGRPDKRRPFDLGGRRQADEGLIRDETPEEQENLAADDLGREPAQRRPNDDAAPENDQDPSSPPSADSPDDGLDFQA